MPVNSKRRQGTFFFVIRNCHRKAKKPTLHISVSVSLLSSVIRRAELDSHMHTSCLPYKRCALFNEILRHRFCGIIGNKILGDSKTNSTQQDTAGTLLFAGSNGQAFLYSLCVKTFAHVLPLKDLTLGNNVSQNHVPRSNGRCRLR